MGFKAIIKIVLSFVGDLLLRTALDAASRQVLKRAVETAEASGKTGKEKFQLAMDFIADEGTESLKTASKQKLGSLIEEQVAKLK